MNDLPGYLFEAVTWFIVLAHFQTLGFEEGIVLIRSSSLLLPRAAC